MISPLWLNQEETSSPERALQEGTLKSMRKGEEKRKEKDDTRVQGEEEEGIGGTIHLQEEVKRTVLELPVEPLSILASQSWRKEETEG